MPTEKSVVILCLSGRTIASVGLFLGGGGLHPQSTTSARSKGFFGSGPEAADMKGDECAEAERFQQIERGELCGWPSLLSFASCSSSGCLMRRCSGPSIACRSRCSCYLHCGRGTRGKSNVRKAGDWLCAREEAPASGGFKAPSARIVLEDHRRMDRGKTSGSSTCRFPGASGLA